MPFEQFFSGLLTSVPGAVAQGLFWGLMAIGVYITYRILDVADLTVDGSFATGGAVFAVLVRSGCDFSIAILAAFIAGLLAGMVTGVLHTKLGIPAILAGILTQLALYSVNLRIQGMNSNLSISSRNYKLFITLSNSSNWTNPLDNSILRLALLIAVVIAVLYWFFRTEFGSGIRAAGSNPRMARAQGINTETMKIVGLMLSNGLVAVAGCLSAQFNGANDVNSGRGAIVIGLAAIIIGETLFSKVFRTFVLQLVAVTIGGIVYYLVMQVVLQAGLDPADLKLLIASVVALFLGFPYIRKQLAARSIGRKTKGVN